MSAPLYWIDAQLPPILAQWLTSRGAQAQHVEELGVLRTPDTEIFAAARAIGAVIVTKDEDFVRLVERLGTPPQVVWITVGNVRNHALMQLCARRWLLIEEQILAGEPLVELADSP